MESSLREPMSQTASESLQTSGVMFEIQAGAERWFVFARLREPDPPPICPAELQQEWGRTRGEKTRCVGEWFVSDKQKKTNVWKENTLVMDRTRETKDVLRDGKQISALRGKKNPTSAPKLKIWSICVFTNGHRISCQPTAKIIAPRRLKRDSLKLAKGKGT